MNEFKVGILLMLGIWTGLVLGISFIEAPLKFQAPNMTLELGLGIGQLVFGALNKIEIMFGSLLAIFALYFRRKLNFTILLSFSIIILVVTLQSIWLLPVLDVRAESILVGNQISSSNHHFYYVGFELVKVVMLIFGFIKLYGFKSDLFNSSSAHKIS